jgi:hypothetical protein
MRKLFIFALALGTSAAASITDSSAQVAKYILCKSKEHNTFYYRQVAANATLLTVGDSFLSAVPGGCINTTVKFDDRKPVNGTPI